MGATAALGMLSCSTLNLKLKSEYLEDLSSSQFPNIRLHTHEGKAVKFYDDLVRGKVVVINMMYTECKAACPMMTANLQRVQKLCGDRLGRDVFMYSITLRPDIDTPERLQEYVDRHHITSGWQFLTGAVEDIEHLRYLLGFYDRDPGVDRDPSSHTRVVRIGNDKYNRWTMSPALAAPEQILAAINHVDPSIVHTYNGGVQNFSDYVQA